MVPFSEEFTHVTAAGPTSFKNLTLFPLVRRDTTAPEPEYLLLEEAITQGLARVCELSDAGSVPELRFENNADKPVLLLDGEELIGAKQNRVLNLTILAPEKQTIVIPVSCVEAGRWRMETPDFMAAAHVMYSRARAARSEQVTESMRASGTHSSDQVGVWDELAAKALRLGADSPTGAMAAIYERHALSIEEYVRAFHWADGQAGVLFAVDCRPLGLDLFDHPSTMRRLFPKLVRSYALDALDSEPCAPGPVTEEAACDLLKSVSVAQVFTQPAVGLGKDVRFLSSAVSGSALWANERYVHICAFVGNGFRRAPAFQTRVSRPTRRRL
jgi:hypothetical protein